MNTFVLYHKDCFDGLGAAWAAYHYFKTEGGESEVTYLPVQYNEPFPLISLTKETTIYIVDFSYPKDTLIDINSLVGKLQVIDHHKTSQEALSDLNFAIFDMGKSGAVLTWEYFHPHEPVPELLLYVQDRDLWQWKLRKSREVSAALASYPKTIDQFEQLLNHTNIESLILKGEILLQNTKQIVESLASKAELNMNKFRHDFIGIPVTIPIINSSTLQSELGEQLLKNYPNAPFAAIYFHPTLKEIVWSLRSRSTEDIDVSIIAKAHGGGGHRNAAGFKENLVNE